MGEAFSRLRSKPSYFVFTLDSRFVTASGPPTTGLNTLPIVRPMMKCVPKLCR